MQELAPMSLQWGGCDITVFDNFSGDETLIRVNFARYDQRFYCLENLCIIKHRHGDENPQFYE